MENPRAEWNGPCLYSPSCPWGGPGFRQSDHCGCGTPITRTPEQRAQVEQLREDRWQRFVAAASTTEQEGIPDAAGFGR